VAVQVDRAQQVVFGEDDPLWAHRTPRGRAGSIVEDAPVTRARGMAAVA